MTISPILKKMFELNIEGIDSMENISPTLKYQDLILTRRKQNLPIYNFGIGSNPLSPPKSIIESLKRYSHLKQDTGVSGIPELLDIFKIHYKQNGFLVDNIIFGNGLKELLYILQLSFKGKIFHITPSCVSYKEQIRVLDRMDDLIEIETIIEDNYEIDFLKLEEEFIKYSNYDKLLIFNNPNNPLGLYKSNKSLVKLCILLKKYNCVVFADEIYINLTYPNKITSISELLPDLCIIGNSLSKDIGCGGYRLGWMVFPENLGSLYNRCNNNASSIYSCVSTPLQYLTYELYKNFDVLKEHSIFMNIICRFIRTKTDKILRITKLKYVLPNSTWYIFLNFDNYKSLLYDININNSIELADYLLVNYGIVSVAGEYFNNNSMSLRFSLIDIDLNYLNTGMTVEDISLEKGCANIERGLKRLVGFLILLK